MQCLLGIDLGTSGLKAALFDLEGRILGKGYHACEYLPAPPGWAEQDPHMWWDGACQAIQTALATSDVRTSEVVGIGVCGFHHCPVFLDAAGKPTRPTIVTHDTRLGASLEELRREGILEQIVAETGSLVLTGHFPPIYQYVLTHDRQALASTRWIMLAKDYIRYRLTGQVGTEICDATGTNLVNMPAREWSNSLCTLMQVPQEWLPNIGESTGIAGEVTEAAAQATGLAPGTPVIYGGGDSHCGLVGLGVVGSGEVGLLLGTNSTLRASFRGFRKESKPRVWMQQHVVPGLFTASASSMAGSSVLAWFKDAFYSEPDATGNDSYAKLQAWASTVPPGADGLLFHPYLYGERSPFYNPDSRGSFLGISHRHNKGHFVRSVLEGVAFCVANCFELINDIALGRGEQIAAVRMGESGGGRLEVWRQIITDALDFGIEVMQVEEPGALGAALLAGVGIKKYASIQEAVKQTVSVSTRTSPDPDTSALYREKRSLFNQAYQTLEPVLYRQSYEQA